MPAAICLAGLGVIVARGADETSLEGGAAIIGAGLSVALLNYLYRVGVTGDKERRSEDAARAYFDEHGKWPDEVAADTASPDDPHAAPHRDGAAAAGHPRPPAPQPPRRPT